MRVTYPLILVSIVFLVLLWSAIDPLDRFTWCLETLPVFLGGILLWLTRRSFFPTRILCTLLAWHAIILCVGGHYTYAEVPLGFWFQDTLNLSRNHYDRLGHFAQGFVPAILVREIFLRKNVVKPGWLFFVVCCVCLSISAFYELIEWWTSLATGEAADAFLGTQGDVWDTHWDMFWALIGSILALTFLSSKHDAELQISEESSLKHKG